MEPIRVLQVVPNMQAGGLESFIMNVYRHIDRNKVQFDFLVHYNKHCFFDDEIENLGGTIYRFSVREDNRVFKYIRALNRFFREHTEYKVIHGHMASLAFIYLYVAKKYKIPIRIIHSHNSKTEKTMKGYCKLFLSKFAKRNANTRFSCSKMAGKFLFGNKNYKVIPNAIDIDKLKLLRNDKWRYVNGTGKKFGNKICEVFWYFFRRKYFVKSHCFFHVTGLYKIHHPCGLWIL